MPTRIRQLARLCIPALLAAAAVVPFTAHTQLLGQGGLGGDIGGITEPLGESIGRTVDDAAGRVDDITEPFGDELEQQVDNLGDTFDATLDQIDRIAAAATENFLGNEDPQGQPIEEEVWVVLVPAEFADLIPGWGFSIRERDDLGGLDLIMLRVDAPDDQAITQVELELNLEAPGTVVDFNHIYLPSQDAGSSLAGRAGASGSPPPVTVPANALKLGLIDSAIAADHSAFANATIVQQDFVPYQGERPRAHGTAVASIALDTLTPRAQGRPVALLAASVFFVDKREQIATTGSLVAALEWFGKQNVHIINMSLTGPANRVLEAALAATARKGDVVVAAVGNDGPTGKPLYPAAYDSVLGITAVDDKLRIYRRANRGPHVAFAAPGVRVRAASADGDFSRETGTSMAAPVAAAVIASALAHAGGQRDAVLNRLQQQAIDLGDAGFDDVYGYGLIAPFE